MEENNRKGSGVFYAVVGVATLVVAIIGATFAYFSASTTAEKSVTGDTLNIAGTFAVEVTKLAKSGGKASSDNLVPAKFGDNVTLTKDNAAAAVTSALTNRCEEANDNGGYTGCHIWKVTAKTGQDLATASLTLNITAPKGNNWSYVVFKNDQDLTTLDGTAGKVTLSASPAAVGKFTTLGTTLDMHNGAKMAKAEGKDAVSETYYIMVYLQNTTNSQNTTTDGGVDETGTYNGTVTFSAAGGAVTASFSLTQ